MSTQATNKTDQAAGPLAGFRVIDITQNVLGPICGQILGDMGADVIKVESPEGDTTRHIGAEQNPNMGPLFVCANRNKRSLVLDLKRPAAHAALMKLARTADVFLHSIRFDAAERLKIGYKDVVAINPKVVYASAGGYRQDSDRRDWPAFDDVIQAASGIAALNKMAGGEPSYLPMVACDKICGYVLASSIGMALLARERTGEGQEVHVAMMDAMVAFLMIEHFQGATFGDASRGLGYNRIFTRHRRPYQTLDGYIALMAVNDRQWQRLFVAMDRPELATDPRFARLMDRYRNIDECYGVVTNEMQKRTTAEWRRLLDEADVPNGPVNDLQDIVDDPYLKESGFFQEVEHPTSGKFVTLGFGTDMSKTKPSIRRPPPQLGEHSRELLAEAGLNAAEIDLAIGTN